MEKDSIVLLARGKGEEGGKGGKKGTSIIVSTIEIRKKKTGKES